MAMGFFRDNNVEAGCPRMLALASTFGATGAVNCDGTWIKRTGRPNCLRRAGLGVALAGMTPLWAARGERRIDGVRH